MIGQVWIWLKNYIVLVYQSVRCFARGENLEKAELKTAASNRRIEIRPSMKQVLEDQQIQLTNLQSPYVFLHYGGKANPTRQTQGIVDEGYEEKPIALSAHA